MTAIPNFLRPARRRRGAALIIVLSIIFLASALVVAFMMSVRNDLTSVVYYKAGKEAFGLGETAPSIVMSQIREATLSGIDSDGLGTHAWASQPGAIRVWDDQRNLVQIYKLYSAAQMKETNMDFLETEIPTDWAQRPNEFVNLNEPVASTSGSNVFWHYPILRPDALGNIPGLTSSQTVPQGSVVGDPRVCMPVRWLYVSSDGNLSESIQSDSVGRIAFWTDDETCKVNINTASATASNTNVENFPPSGSAAGAENKLGYSYWNIPYGALTEDYNLARVGLSEGEFQRYGGHPATVNLLTVLAGTAFDALPESGKKQTLKNVFSLFPAYRWGGSENNRIPWSLDSVKISLTGSNQKSERLYASVDELRFKASFSGNHREKNTLPAGTGDEETRLSAWRFLLTASSRAPDLNLFGQPRVAIWPLSIEDNELHRTPQDTLIAFCSTYGSSAVAAKKTYYFTRKDPLSQTVDWAEIPRNRALFAYLQRLTSRDIPGFGGNFLGKYDSGDGVAGERDQILTEIFDYIRCVNLNEASRSKPAGFVSYTPTVDPPDSAIVNINAYYSWSLANYMNFRGAGMVLPILINQGGITTRGAGRVPTLSEVGLFAMQAAKPTPPTEPSGKLQTALFFETFSPMQGYMPWTPLDFQLSVQTAMTVAGEPVFLNADAGASTTPFNRTMTSPTGPDYGNQPIGGTDGFAWITGSNLNTYPFGRNEAKTIPVSIPPSGGSSPGVAVSQADVIIDLKMAGVLYQHCEVEFPAANLPIPDPSTKMYLSNRRTIGGINFEKEDVVHSIVPKDGDYRIMSYLQDVPKGFFRKHPDYGTSKHFAHSFRSRRNWGQKGSTINDGTTNGAFTSIAHTDVDLGSSGYNAFWTDRPDIPPDITDLIAKGWTGDWNNGTGDFPDGAYLGKPDDGIRNVIASGLYIGTEFNWYTGAGFFSPTVKMPSAVMFGSLPTGVKRTEAAYRSGNDANAAPWRTLLFCKNPAAGNAHYGATSPHDSLLLDLFTMPVVEPYAISEPSSTAGRINMNYQMLPFTNIERSTALHALLSSQRITAYPDSIAALRGGHPDPAVMGSIQQNTTRIYHPIDIAETLKQFSDRFAQGELFRSPAEMCSLWLVPNGVNLSGTPAWWTSHRATGKNLRERPYATIYPLLTTKSNTYSVHVWAQSLVRGTTKVTGEYRGSTMIERYIDPMDERLGDTSYDPDTHSLEPLYRFRVLEVKRFAP